METDGILWNVLETTCIVQLRARLTPTLTHVVTYELVTSGAEGGAMSQNLAANHRDSSHHEHMTTVAVDLERLPEVNQTHLHRMVALYRNTSVHLTLSYYNEDEPSRYGCMRVFIFPFTVHWVQRGDCRKNDSE